MGTHRRESQSRLILRITKALEDRDTLSPCPACQGGGFRVAEFPSGGYRRVDCSWCQDGFTDKDSVRMFARWLRIRAANKCSD